jgi:acetyl-CoA carboxylase carboxyl transferase subunit beta
LADNGAPGAGVTAGARALVASLCTGFEEFPAEVALSAVDGPLAWSGYDEQRDRAARRTGSEESVLCGLARFGDDRAVVIAFEFGFLGGSVGRAAGACIVAAFERARVLRVPVVSLVASGGSRMQEGFHALSQLQAITRACLRNSQEGIAHISVERDPTTGGMWASLGASADMILGVPGATVAFGGNRVRDAADGDPAFTAEGKFAHGQIDRIVREDDLAAVLAHAVRVLNPDRLGRSGHEAEVPGHPGPVPAGSPASGWEAVQRARAPQRPGARAYLDHYFDTRLEITGDRSGGVDDGILCGFGEREGGTIAYAAQTGTANNPAGFRTATRLLRKAEQFGIAAVTLVDTPGAANGADAERAGVGPALAELFTTVAGLGTPITTLVIGEGGSGGALALAAPENTWVAVDAYFTVIAPELTARILKRDAAEVPALANALHLRPQDLLEAGFVRGVVPG